MKTILKNKDSFTLDNSINFIKDTICLYYNVDRKVYDGKSRKAKDIKIKHLCIYLCMKYLDVTTVKLGSYFNLDHSSVIYIVKKFNGYLDWDEDLKLEVNTIKNILDFKVSNELDVDEKNYYIPLNEFYSIKLQENKAIILKGFNENEIKSLKLINKDNGKDYFSIFEPRKHINQKFYILEKKDEENNNTSQRI